MRQDAFARDHPAANRSVQREIPDDVRELYTPNNLGPIGQPVPRQDSRSSSSTTDTTGGVLMNETASQVNNEHEAPTHLQRCNAPGYTVRNPYGPPLPEARGFERRVASDPTTALSRQLMAVRIRSTSSPATHASSQHPAHSFAPWRSTADTSAQSTTLARNDGPSEPTAEQSSIQYPSMSMIAETSTSSHNRLPSIDSVLAQQLPQSPSLKAYLPSTMALTHAGLIQRDPRRMPSGSNYEGDAFASSFLDQVEGLPDAENCALWLVGLPVNTQHAHLFNIIRCGAVWSLHLNDPTPQYPTKAAKLVFVTAHAAATFYHEHRQFEMGGHRVFVRYNKYGMRTRATRETRVLIIDSSKHMDEQFWYAQFLGACVFQLVGLKRLSEVDGKLSMEFQFARVDGQAQSCRQLVERRFAGTEVVVRHGQDPCGAGLGLS